MRHGGQLMKHAALSRFSAAIIVTMVTNTHPVISEGGLGDMLSWIGDAHGMSPTGACAVSRKR